MIYKATFTGCTNGAIGIRHRITTWTKGDTEDDARTAIYDRWEHISKLVLEPFSGTLYDACIALGIPTSNHYSDLYIPDTPDTRWLVKVFDVPAESFTSNIDGSRMFDVPFAFLPFWDSVVDKRA